MRVAGEAQETGFAREYLEPGIRGRREIVHDGVTAGALEDAERQQDGEHSIELIVSNPLAPTVILHP